jgi:hypothetical protein
MCFDAAAEVAFSIGWVIGIAALVVVAVGGSTALYVRHRRIYARYMLLRHEMEDMGDVKLESTNSVFEVRETWRR